MTKTFSPLIKCAIISYSIKTFVDVVMLIFTIFEKGDIYYDDWYLLMPQIISTVFISAFYFIFFSNEFYGAFIKISSAVLVFFNIAFIGVMLYDRTMGYVFYFSLAATINFLNALHVKCNIIPARKPGAIEYSPLTFEIMSFAVMAISMYSLFCGLPLTFNKVTNTWDYYNVMTSLRLNIISSGILLIEYLLCLRNKCEFIRDNIIDASTVSIIKEMKEKSKLNGKKKHRRFNAKREEY